MVKFSISVASRSVKYSLTVTTCTPLPDKAFKYTGIVAVRVSLPLYASLERHHGEGRFPHNLNLVGTKPKLTTRTASLVQRIIQRLTILVALCKLNQYSLLIRLIRQSCHFGLHKKRPCQPFFKAFDFASIISIIVLINLRFSLLLNFSKSKMVLFILAFFNTFFQDQGCILQDFQWFREKIQKDACSKQTSFL